MNQPRHQSFSPARILAISSNTLLELVRLKVFYFILLFAVLIIGSSAFVVKLSFQEQFQVLKDVSLGAMSIFTWLLAVLATAMLLPKDIEDRTLYTILAKPVPRFEYLIGKLLGVLFLLFVATVMMSIVFVITLYAREQMAIAENVAEMGGRATAAQIAQISAETKAQTFNANLLPGILVIYVKAALCAALTLFISTFASSWIFTIIVSTIAYLIGHVQGIAREAWLTDVAHQSIFARGFLSLVALLFPDLQLFNLVDDIVAGNAIPLLLFARTVGLGAIYVAVYLLLAYFVFAKKEL